jgi:Ca2+-binding RTX toxin-like protein
MPIVTFPGASPASIQDSFDLIDFILTEATIDNFSASQFDGSGTFDGMPALFGVTGTNLSLGMIGGFTYVTAGILNTLTVVVGGVTYMTITDIGIDMAVFAPIIHADDTGAAPLGIENFLMSLDYTFDTNTQDDVILEGTLVGDGAPFNPAGDDVFLVCDGNDNVFAGTGNDTVYGEEGNDTLFGGAGFDRLEGGIGNDRLDGGNHADNLLGGAGVDTLLGGAGFDRLFGGDGNDLAYGGSGTDGVFGELGNDRLFGQGDNDRMYGGVGNDFIDGGADNDTLYGGAGFDTLLGSTGNDLLWGYFNADTFVFADFGGGFGQDTIGDFAATNMFERIDLSLVSSITNLQDLMMNHISVSGANIIIDALGGNTITLLNVALSDLDATDFIF